MSEPEISRPQGAQPGKTHPKLSEHGRLIEETVDEHVLVLQKIKETLASTISEAALAVSEAFRSGNRVLLFGNGGSASDALHIEGELTNRFYRDRPGLPAITLGASLSSLTATANDYSFEDLFARQVVAQGKEGDVAIGISTSGKSKNIVRGLAQAREMKLITIGLTGQDPALVGDHCDIVLAVPSKTTPRIQEGHIVIGHLICQIVEDELFPESV